MSQVQSDNDYLKKILLAPVYDVAVKSDLDYLPRLSEQLNNKIWLKREDQQPVKSFKIRGAYNKLINLSAAQKAKGVVAASAGNHAQGVALAANKLEINATIVMPETTPEIKIEAVRQFGGSWVNLVLKGKSYDAAGAEAKRLAEEEHLELVHPFDDPDVIVGQGTIAREMLEQQPQLNLLFVAVGGGGLAAGTAIYLKQLKPHFRVIGVESEESACLTDAWNEQQPTCLDNVGIFADGVAVKQMGKETFRLCKEYLDDVITVSSDEICGAIKDIFDDTRVIAEPAGALSVAGIKKYLHSHKINNAHIAGVLCGANINFHTLRYVSERCELGEQKEAVLAVKIPERKGSFRKFCEIIGGRSITEFNYRFAKHDEAHIFVGIKLREGMTELKTITDALEDNDYPWFDLSDNETAKLHVRYMVGGRPPSLLEEHVFSFQFPEYPGALMKFLTTLGERWNITLFHYRNHGAAEGSVLAGFELPEEDKSDFELHLRQLGYRYREETQNPSYRFFLSDLNGVF